MTIKKRCPVIWSVLIIVSGCGLFLPGEPENPDNTIQDVDPLKFRNVLSRNTEAFDFQLYDDLFSADFIYVDAVVPSEEIRKSTLTGRLFSIEQLYINNTIPKKLQVQWEYTTSPEPPLNKNVTNVLQPRTYRAFIIDTIIKYPDSSVVKYKFIYSGEAIFNLQYDVSRERWQISRWKDKNNGSGKPFFHPQFVGPPRFLRQIVLYP